jgi:hypothetical protein
MSYIVGRNVTTRVNGAVVCQMGGSLNDQVNLITKTTSCGNGYQELAVGIRRANGTVRFSTKVSEMPQVFPGTSFTLVITNSVTGRAFNVPAIIESINDQWVVDGDYTIEGNWQSSGSYTVSNA